MSHAITCWLDWSYVATRDFSYMCDLQLNFSYICHLSNILFLLVLLTNHVMTMLTNEVLEEY
jgi:hypothetical protein